MGTSNSFFFKNSVFAISAKLTQFEQSACSQYDGMEPWVPSTRDEMTFVEQKILANLSSQFYSDKMTVIPGTHIIAMTRYFHIFIGVFDRPNGNCVLYDLSSNCPVTNYGTSQPAQSTWECTSYWRTGSSYSWRDVLCSSDFYCLCRKRI